VMQHLPAILIIHWNPGGVCLLRDVRVAGLVLAVSFVLKLLHRLLKRITGSAR